MIRAIEFPNPAEFRRARLPGSFHIDLTQGGPDGAAFWFFCPCGCGGTHRILVSIGGGEHPKTYWAWNRSMSEPTLSPSIKSAPCGWHGWLRDGYWEVA